MRTAKVEDKDFLVRDLDSRAIVNTNIIEFEQHMATKAARMSRAAEITKQAEEINNLKCELEDIKCMLVQLLNKKDR